MTEKVDVFIATPCMTGEVWTAYMKSCLNTIMLMTNQGISVSHNFLNGCSNICVARAVLADDFLQSGAKSMLFIDADLSWRPEDAIRVAMSPHDVIGGVYPSKEDNSKWLGKWRPGPTRLLEADGLPGGFLKISRNAFATIAEKFPQLRCDYRGRDMHAYFENGIFDGEYLGEDFAFTRRWQQCGGKAFIDPDVTFEHYGHKAWSGNLSQYIEFKASQEPKPARRPGPYG
jgi:hypothetical protein